MERDEELEKEIASYIKNLKREFWNELPALGEEGLASIARHFAQWQKERMMNGAEQIRFDCSLPCKTFNNLKAKGVEIGDKLFIIKE